MPAPRTTLLTLGILAALALPAAAGASIKIAGNAHSATLAVNARGVATVTYVKNGRRMSAVVAPNARVTWKRRAPGPDVSLPTAALPLPMLVALRVTPDGRFWALQSWQRLKSGPVELRFSRWRGAPTLLEMRTWCCKWRSEVVAGRATFHGRPIFGYSATPQGVALDSLGRNVYVDALRNGRWVRLTGLLTRRHTGKYGLWIRPYWRGSQYQARIVGPNWGPTLAPDAYAWAASSL